MKTKVEYVDEYLYELKNVIKDAIKLPTKEEVIYEIAEKLNFHLIKISDMVHSINEIRKEQLKEVLGTNLFVCTRVWDAWGAGTMTEEDFLLAGDDPGLIDELYNKLS